MTDITSTCRTLAAALPGWRVWHRSFGSGRPVWVASRAYGDGAVELNHATPAGLTLLCRDLDERTK